MLRVLVTGAGGPSAVACMRALADEGTELHAGDIDRLAAGLHLVAPDRRVLLPRGDDPRFVDELLAYCVRQRIDVVVPTVDVELLPVALACERFAARGIRVMVAEPPALELALDKFELVGACAPVCAVPHTALFDERFDATRAATEWGCPIIVKPRRGAGGRGVRCCSSLHELAHVQRDADTIAQQYLPGAEYSVDVLSDAECKVLAVVPRLRLKIDSGIAVAGRTLHHHGLEASARAVVRRLRLAFVSNLQFREDSTGTPRLIEVNARFPGTMPLTVASGVDMPRLALDVLLGRPLPPAVGEFRDVAMVRTWQEHFLEPDAFEHVGQMLTVAEV